MSSIAARKNASAGLRSGTVRLGVVANRVRRSTPVYQPLERFLGSLGLPFLARLPDSEVFVQAAESGIGIFEGCMPGAGVFRMQQR